MKKLLILLLLAILFTMEGCYNSSINPTLQSKYPTKIGNQWEYQTTYTFEYYDSTGNIDSVEILDFGNTIVKIDNEKDSVNGISNLVMFSSYEVTSTDSISKSWYSNSDCGLYVIAYTGAGRSQPVLPKLNQTNFFSIVFSNHKMLMPDISNLFNSNPSDSIQLYDTPRKVLDYPLNKGAQWVELVFPFYRERFVEKMLPVEVFAGMFNCYVIESKSDLNVELTDYMNLEDGLIKRIVYADSIDIVTNGNPDSSVYARFTSTSQLVNKSF